MNTPCRSRPAFIGPNWLLSNQGFAYASISPINFANGRNDSKLDEWVQLLTILEQLKAGDFDNIRTLFSLVLGSTNVEIRFLGLKILGHSATREFRWRLTELFEHSDVDTRMAAYGAALCSCDVRVINPLLAAYDLAKGQERLAIMSSISHLLESEPDNLYDDLDELTRDEYSSAAGSTLREVEVRCGNENAIFEGRLLSVSYVLDRIKVLCESEDADAYSGAIATYFDLFEAMTGYPRGNVFDDDGSVAPHYAIEVVKSFEQSNHRMRFRDGRRYFFGNELPS